MPAETSIGYLALGGEETLISISAADTYDIVFPKPFIQEIQRFSFAAGAGAYTYKIVLDVADSSIVRNSTYTFILEFAASTNPTVEFYNDTVVGTLLQTVSGLDETSTFLFEAYFTGTEWKKCDGRYTV